VENPNAEYPPGHYLPFPMAVVWPEVIDALDLTLTVFMK
jgi:hypothetical protein